MDILKLKNNFNNSNTNSLFLYKTPKIFKSSDYETKVFNESNYNEKILNNISSFINDNYEGISLSTQDIINYFNIGCELAIIYDKNNLLGANLLFHFPIDIKTDLDKSCPVEHPDELKSFCYKDSFIITYNSYLVIDKKHRKKNIASYFLHSNIEYGYNKGILMFMGTHDIKRTINPVEFNTWSYPLNFSKLDKIEYVYPINHKSLFELKEDPKLIVKEINENNIIKAYDFYLNKTEDKKFAFKPSFILWKKWMKSFYNYIVLENDEIIGFFSYQIRKKTIKKYNINMNKATLLFCVGDKILDKSGDKPIILIAALANIKQKADIVSINDLCIPEYNLSKINAQKIKKRYLNIYNTSIKLDKSDVCIPIF